MCMYRARPDALCVICRQKTEYKDLLVLMKHSLVDPWNRTIGQCLVLLERNHIVRITLKYLKIPKFAFMRFAIIHAWCHMEFDCQHQDTYRMFELSTSGHWLLKQLGRLQLQFWSHLDFLDGFWFSFYSESGRTAAVAFIGHVLSGECVGSERSLRKALMSWLVRCSQHSCKMGRL